MNASTDAISQDVTVVNALGLHARSASRIAAIANNAASQVWVCKGAECADASDILDVISLQCPAGTRLTIRIEDPADKVVMEAIVELVASGFGELTENE
jgi:phosphocarrier protein